MKKCLCDDVVINHGDINAKIKCNEVMFLDAVKKIADDIRKNYFRKNTFQTFHSFILLCHSSHHLSS